MIVRVAYVGRYGGESRSFFFNDTATTEIYTLSLHDALPISGDHPAAESDIRFPVAHARLWLDVAHAVATAWWRSHWTLSRRPGSPTCSTGEASATVRPSRDHHLRPGPLRTGRSSRLLGCRSSAVCMRLQSDRCRR